ncbi:MAG: DUF177 domain-containing protein [Firmicutes bacterium]|nr:DUF177 domain-containing protein [Bacillota bacterium]
MHIYIPELRLKNGEAVNYRIESQLSEFPDQFPSDGSLNLVISASCTGDKVLVNGVLEVTASVDCSRCLEQFIHTFKTDFSEAFTVISGIPEDDNLEQLAEDTANMLTISGDYLYLDEYIRQLVILAREYSPICKPDCKGLCSECGADLNKAPCNCSSNNKQIDVRLLKLKELSPGS